MGTTTEIVAKEGWKPIIIVALLLIVSLFFNLKFIALLFCVLLLCLVYFYRNTERIPEDATNESVIAPLDGIIKGIQTKEDGIYLNVRKPICFCGLLRMPVAEVGHSGRALTGAFVKGLKSGDSRVGERLEISFFQNEASENALKLTLYPRIFGQSVLYFSDSTFKLGERLGFFLKGDALLRIPLESELRVNIGDTIYAGKTLMAKLKRA